MKTIHKGMRARRGGVLVATLVAVLAVGALSVCLLELDSTRLKRQVASIDNKRAFNLAEAGLSEAYFAVATGRTGNVGSMAEPAKFGGGLFWVEASEVQPGVIGLESTGMAGSGRVTLSLVVRRESRNVASLGVLSSQDISVGKRAVIDAYDSGGTPGVPLIEPASAPAAPLRSNGNIVLGEAASVRGDATPGPLGAVTFGLLASVTGSTAPAAATTELIEIEVPQFDYSADVVHTDPSALVLSAPEAAHARLEVGPGAKVVLRGPSQVVLDQLIVDGTGTLEVDTTNGPVELYVTDWVNLKSGAQLSFPTQDTSAFRMLISATGVRDRDGDGLNDLAVKFQAAGQFFGTLYAPLARVQLPAGYELFGTLAADRLVLSEGAKVHFDTALEGADNGTLAEVDPLSWRIVEIPVEVARDLSEDPFDALAVDASLLATPAESYEDAAYQIHVKYLDLSSNPQSYRGPESGFDWAQVKQVTSLLRQPL